MKRGRTLLVIGLILSLITTVVLQKVALAERSKLLRTVSGTSTRASLANMDSYALALLLGGMRGPLVMFLWMNSEAQKQAKDLEGVETQIEWIRLLQPEFDTVHLFQIWNKAYNISVQMSSLANKYSVILDALEYAGNVEKQRPDNLNILSTIGNIFNDKLAGSAEKTYYRKRIREDTQYRPPQRESRLGGTRPTRFESILDEKGLIKPELTTPRVSLQGSAGSTSSERYDGSELQFLKRYAPFPYGVSPFGLAYNYARRSQALQNESGQRHLQIAPMVVDSRPALILRAWTDEEWDLGSKAEDRLMGVPVPADRYDGLLATAQLDPLNLTKEQAKARAADTAEALYRYELAIKLAGDADASFKAHLAIPDYQMHLEMYRSHLEHLEGVRAILTADRSVVQAVTAEGEGREALKKVALEEYQKALRIFRIIRLRYYIADEYYKDIFPPGLGRWTLERATDAQLAALIVEVDRRNKAQGYDMMQDDTTEYMSYINRCANRIKVLSK